MRNVQQEDLERDVVVAITDPSSPKGGLVPSPQYMSVPSGDRGGQGRKHRSEGARSRATRRNRERARRVIRIRSQRVW